MPYAVTMVLPLVHYQYLGSRARIIEKQGICRLMLSVVAVGAGIPMIDFVCACHAGYVDNTPIVGAGALPS